MQYPPLPTFERIENTEHKKSWGSEFWLVNNEEYCGKILRFDKKGGKCSNHVHRNKREHFFCNSGSFILTYINGQTAQKLTKIINPGDIVEIPRMLPHQIECIEPGDIYEFSTHHEENDSYRVEPGDGQVNSV